MTAYFYQRDLEALGFVPMPAVLAGGAFPRSRHLLANVSRDRERLGLVISRRELYRDTERDPVFITEDNDTKMIDGRHTEPADRAWRRRTQRERQIMLVAGPRPTGNRTPGSYLFDPATMVAAVALAQ